MGTKLVMTHYFVKRATKLARRERVDDAATRQELAQRYIDPENQAPRAFRAKVRLAT
jgi:hypothetical protein